MINWAQNRVIRTPRYSNTYGWYGNDKVYQEFWVHTSISSSQTLGPLKWAFMYHQINLWFVLFHIRIKAIVNSIKETFQDFPNSWGKQGISLIKQLVPEDSIRCHEYPEKLLSRIFTQVKTTWKLWNWPKFPQSLTLLLCGLIYLEIRRCSYKIVVSKFLEIVASGSKLYKCSD